MLEDAYANPSHASVLRPVRGPMLGLAAAVVLQTARWATIEVPTRSDMNSKIKIALWLLGAAIPGATLLIWTFAGQRSGQSTISYSQFLQQVDAGRVVGGKISAGNSGADAARVRLMNGAAAQTVLPGDYSVALAAMQQRMMNVEIQDADANPTRLLINATPFLILLAVWLFFMFNRGLLGRR